MATRRARCVHERPRSAECCPKGGREPPEAGRCGRGGGSCPRSLPRAAIRQIVGTRKPVIRGIPVENNVRSKIVKEHLNDPAFYEKMSTLLEEIIADRKAKAIQYEEYLQRIAELASRLQAGQADETPQSLDTPGKRALYNNLGHNEDLALRIDRAVLRRRPDAWRGVQARESLIKSALYDVLQDVAEVERIFVIVKAQREY